VQGKAVMGFSASALMTESTPKYRLKGPTYETSTRIQGASGLHHLMGNQWHIMVCIYAFGVSLFLTWLSVFQADSLDRKFERPLRHHLDGYKTVVAVSIRSNLSATIPNTGDCTGTFIILRTCT
jgi:hypothetical protein